jgi:hypothetical protein
MWKREPQERSYEAEATRIRQFIAYNMKERERRHAMQERPTILFTTMRDEHRWEVKTRYVLYSLHHDDSPSPFPFAHEN